MKKTLASLLIAILVFNTFGVFAEASGEKAKSFVGKPDVSDWFEWKFPDDKKAKGTAIDVSFMLDAPAGKHGFLSNKGEDMFFEDGTKAKFWGTNIVAPAMFDTKENLEKLADRIGRSGFNLVRLHHMDADWAKMNIFGKTTTTRELSDEMVDRVFYFISLLKERGVYIYTDLMVARAPYFTDDKIPFGGENDAFKKVSIFDPYLIELQKEYATQLLTRVNPYTGLALKDEPAVAFIDIQNEMSLLGMGSNQIASSYYQAELQK
ncbi:MAG: hypothetical protein RSA27_03455, partial [Oscillospiraceae bacterium]